MHIKVLTSPVFRIHYLQGDVAKELPEQWFLFYADSIS